MGYKSDTLATTIGRLNTQYFLPAIQREFVWRPDQIIKLFDSVLRGYPISSCLLWELKPENRDKWKTYRFISDASEAGVHNTNAATDGVQQLTLVLDGQQRLTSCLIGLKGSYTIKKKYKRWDDPKAWEKQYLFLDLLNDPDVEDEEAGQEIYYGLAFHPEPPKSDKHHQWFKVGRVLDFDSEGAFYKFRQEMKAALPKDATIGQSEILERNLERLYRAVWKDDVINYYTEREQNYDRVLDIFVRANEGGTKLTKSDLLLSMVTAEWKGVNAREEIHGFVDRINTTLSRKNDFDKDFVMKTCLVLTDLPVKYEVENFSTKNLQLIQEKWGAIKDAIERAAGLANSFGIDKENLTSANALIPVIYYLYHQPGETLRGTSAFDAKNAKAVRRWLIASLLRNVFGGSSDTMLQAVREVLKQHTPKKTDFPLEQIYAATAAKGRSTMFDKYAVDGVLDFTYGKPVTFLALSLLYEENGWGTMQYHEDHIFPQALFKPKALEKAGFDGTTRDDLIKHKDRLGNLNLLLASENVQKSDQDFGQWLKTRASEFKQRHLIPADDSLYSLTKYKEFLAAREALIRDRLEKL